VDHLKLPIANVRLWALANVLLCMNCALEASISVNNATALGLSYIVMGPCTGATAWYYLSYHSTLRQLIFQGPMQPGELGTRLTIIYSTH